MSDPAHHHRPLSAILQEMARDDAAAFCVGDLLVLFGGRAMGAMLLVFGLVCTLPLPPGGTTIFGAPLMLLAPQLAIGARAPWLPAAVRRRSIPMDALRRGMPRLLWWLRGVESISRPRLTFLFGSVGDRLIGGVCTVLAVVLILPIPLGNVLPAASVSLLSFSLIQRDGVLALAGYALAAASAGVLVLAAGLIARGALDLLAWMAAA
jgi:hypothetical protein